MKSCLENPGTPRQTSLVPTAVVLASIITWPVLLIYTQQWQNVILAKVCQKHQLFMLRVPSAQHLPDYNSSSFLTFGLFLNKTDIDILATSIEILPSWPEYGTKVWELSCSAWGDLIAVWSFLLGTWRDDERHFSELNREIPGSNTHTLQHCSKGESN